MPNAKHASRPDFETLLLRFQQRKACVAVIGMGYVGFPLAIAVHQQGFSVLAHDVDAQKIEALNKGKSYLSGIPDASIHTMLSQGRFRADTDAASLQAADAILICVPTPLTGEYEPDLSYVTDTAKMIAPQLRPGQLVVLESTTYPGTTRDVVKPLLEASGLQCGRDFYLAYSPEREDPSNGFYSTHTIPKVVSADDPQSQALVMALYRNIVTEVVPVSSTATAEAVKLTENIFRSINIAMVNELKMVFTAMGINVWEVINAAKTKPFGFMPFYPGPGVGGHCIPIDPFYLSWKAKQHGVSTPLIELAGRINDQMPHYVIERLRAGMPLEGSRILLLGITYKANVDDMRESPALVLFDLLLRHGARVDYHDPYIAVIPPTREHDALAGIRSVALTPKNIAGYDAVIIVTDHAGIDYAEVVRHGKRVVDTRNVTAGFSNSHIIRA
jgi:UDP-N-acetyl-D-glucosamine dehydrogenase